MKHPGSFRNFNESFIKFKEEIIKINRISTIKNDFIVKNFLIFSQKILESDILLEDSIKKIEKIYKIGDNLSEFLEYIKDFKDMKKIWNNYDLWLLISIFFYYWKDTIYYFQKEIYDEYILEMNIKWDEIQILINKWKTDFSTEFILSTSFLLMKKKSEFLDCMKILGQKFENTKYSNFIENIINLISINDFSLDIFQPPDNNFESQLCLIFLISRYGNSECLRICYKLVNPIIKDLWFNINKRKDKLEVHSFIRDWLSAKYIQLMLLKKLELYKTIREEELNYFSLSPRKFERLIFWIIKTKSEWKNVQWRGASGSEKGKDICAVKKKNNRVWIIQAKRVKNFGPNKLENEFLNVEHELKKYKSEGYIIFIAKNATDKLREMGEKISQKFNYKIKIKDNSDLDFIIKQSQILLKEFFNYQII